MMSEKSPFLPTHAPPPERSKSRLVWVCAALTFLGYHAYTHTSLDTLLRPDPAVSSGISWWPCPDITTTECAYFTVPRDYAHPEANDTVSIFMRKFPATVARKDYLGSILMNPGGPGGSGNGLVALGGHKFSAMVDGRYDIIGFDPRGVNMTTPKLGCHENEAQAIHSSYKQNLLGSPYDARGSTSLSSGTRARMEHAYLTRLNASFTATSLACVENGNRPMLESVSTAYVVQDMERIVDALGEDGLNFWGFSYGTILGSTFAAMRPHLVKHMVLDGVSNAESYHRDIYQWGVDGLTDNQKTLEGFFDSCVEAGPDRCAFAKSPAGRVSTKGAELQSRLEALYSKLRDEPIPVPKSLTGPGTLTASDAKGMVFTGLYSPRLWPGLAQAIAEAEAGNPQLLYDRAYGSFEALKPSNGSENVFNRYMELQMLPVTISAIMCSDSEKPTPKSLDQYAQYIHEIGKLTPVADVWAMLTGFCASWKIRPGQRYDGPWSVEEGLKKTRFPILYASLDADPVTPLAAAQKMAESFGNESAALLVQEGFGHCTVAHPSLCTAKAVRDYFLNGKVPAAGTFCKPEPGYLFPGNETKSISALSAEDKKLWEALEGLEEMSAQFRHI
ncbi:Alpha/Beta hydrolase protein [Rhizoctonia solani]|nr:Alpha/Beta hydrolase protein [Rhizoctonia solani]